MKKKVLLLCLLLALLQVFIGCNTTSTKEQNEEKVLMNQATIYEKIEKVVLELNENSHLYIELLALVSETEYASFFNIDQIRRGFHDPPIPNEFDIRDENNTIQGTGGVLPFPWASDTLRIIYVFWDIEGRYHVFGIDVGDRIDVAGEILLNHGYTIDTSIPQSDWNIERFGRRYTYMKEHVSVSFFVNEDGETIIGISVTVHDPFLQWCTEKGEEGVDWVS